MTTNSRASRRGATAAVTIAGLLGLTACGAFGGNGSTTEQETFDWDGDALTIEVEGGNVRVEHADVDQVEVERTLGGKAAEGERATWELEDSTLTLAVDCKGWFGDCRASYVVVVPDGTDLMVDADAGNVEIEGGEVEVIEAKSDAGNVAVRVDAPIRRIDASSDAGNVEIAVPDGERYRIDISTSAGNAESAIDDDPDSDRILVGHSNAGNVTVETH